MQIQKKNLTNLSRFAAPHWKLFNISLSKSIVFVHSVHKNGVYVHRNAQFYNIMRIILCSLQKEKIAFYTLIPYWWNSRELVFVSDFTAGNSRRQYLLSYSIFIIFADFPVCANKKATFVTHVIPVLYTTRYTWPDRPMWKFDLRIVTSKCSKTIYMCVIYIERSFVGGDMIW